MLLEKIKTPGLSHLSYLIGSQGKAAVIDPRRDCEIYLERARAEGLEITHIFETHRNEDLITGSPVLAKMTGARVLHGPNPADEVVFADTAREGDVFEIGKIRVEVLETPGHTDDHLAFVFHDDDYPEGPVGVFIGDALFVGDGLPRTAAPPTYLQDARYVIKSVICDPTFERLVLGCIEADFCK